MNGQYTPEVFGKIASYISQIAEMSTGEKEWTVAQTANIKHALCSCLNSLGIPFTTEMLDKYLWSEYENIGEGGFSKFIKDNKNDIQAFCRKIIMLNYNGALNIKDGRVEVGGNLILLEKYLQNDLFLTKLADAKYKWHRAHDQMSVLIANNAKAYTKSENNLLTDRLDELMYDEEAQK